VAVRKFPLAGGHGFADDLPLVDGRHVGVVEAKPAGHTLRRVHVQAREYSEGIPDTLSPPVRPLPSPT
jgi:type I restriction enzyme, R subunit